MKIKLHRKEQWDLDCWPWLCVHVERTSARQPREPACVLHLAWRDSDWLVVVVAKAKGRSVMFELQVTAPDDGLCAGAPGFAYCDADRERLERDAERRRACGAGALRNRRAVGLPPDRLSPASRRGMAQRGRGLMGAAPSEPPGNTGHSEHLRTIDNKSTKTPCA